MASIRELPHPTSREAAPMFGFTFTQILAKLSAIAAAQTAQAAQLAAIIAKLEDCHVR